MVGVDTNVVIRLLIEDDPDQTDRVMRLLETEHFYLPLTVVLEAHWVLRNVYRLSRREVATALKAVMALPKVTVEDPARLERAVALADAGMDFADALHLAAMPPGHRFATFDAGMVRLAGGAAFAP